ncbi:MAG TPA: hypothetical protein VF941_06915, partial [Clostridia bacterium]
MFANKDIKLCFHTVSYVINYYYEEDNNKYISATLRLRYNDIDFAVYESFYDLNGEGIDDNFRCF